ncbi:MAG: hypothetical protein ACK5Y2_06755 [Bdellovibrionales bacterium]
MSQYDYAGLYQFLLHTPEQGLRKMLVDQKSFTDAHFNLMLKIVRGCSEADFCQHAEESDYPKVKMGPAEQKIKEKFWGDLMSVCGARGLLAPAQKAA